MKIIRKFTEVGEEGLVITCRTQRPASLIDALTERQLLRNKIILLGMAPSSVRDACRGGDAVAPKVPTHSESQRRPARYLFSRRVSPRAASKETDEAGAKSETLEISKRR